MGPMVPPGQPSSLAQARQPSSLARQPQSLARQAQGCHLISQQQQQRLQEQQCWQQRGLCWLPQRHVPGRGFAAPTAILLTQPAKSSLLPTLLLLEPLLLLLTSQMATLGLPGQTLRLRAQSPTLRRGPRAPKDPKRPPGGALGPKRAQRALGPMGPMGPGPMLTYVTLRGPWALGPFRRTLGAGDAGLGFRRQFGSETDTQDAKSTSVGAPRRRISPRIQLP